MATLNKISERIAYALNDPFNVMLLENIKFSVKYWRATLIRRDIERNGYSDEYSQKISLDLIKVDKLDDCNFTFGCDNILRTKFKIPKPIRIKADVLFKFIGIIDLQGNYKPITYSEIEEIRYTKFNRYTSNVVRCSYINGYVYIYNNTLIKKLFINTPWADPSAINIACGTECYNDDMEFPCPDDMIQQIFNGIVSGEFPMKTKPLGEEIQIENEV